MRTRIAGCAGVALALAGAFDASAAQITFQVNMSAQAALGNFDPATDGVYVAGGAINNWSSTASELLRSDTNPDLWVGAYEVLGDPGTVVEYKFTMNTALSGVVWEGNVGPSGGTGNRVFTLTAADQTLDPVWFNNVSSSTSASSDVTFQVNMSIQQEAGNFDPGIGTVSVAGEFNGWSTSATPLERSQTAPDVWVGTVTIKGALNSSVGYKFVMNGSTWEANNVGPGGSQNRALTVVNGPQTLPVVFFSNVETLPVTLALTFEVDMSAQIAKGNFDPETGTVSVAGAPINGWSSSAWMLERSTQRTNVWTGTFDLTTSDGALVEYKFVMNGGTWEGGNNRTYNIAGTNAQTVPRDYFDRTGNLGAIVLGTVTGGQVTLSWPAAPLVRLQRAAVLNPGLWEDVPGTLGEGSIAVSVGSGQAFFRLVGP